MAKFEGLVGFSTFRFIEIRRFEHENYFSRNTPNLPLPKSGKKTLFQIGILVNQL